MNLIPQKMKHSLFAIVLAATTIAANNAYAAPLTVSYAKDSHELLIGATWLSAKAYNSEVKPREIVIRFDRSIEVSGLESAVKESAGVIDNVNYGYDSLVISALDDTQFSVSTRGNIVAVGIQPAAPATTDMLNSQENLRLQLLEARLLRETGHNRQAKELLDSLHTENPENARVLSEQASHEAYMDHWQRADNLYQQARLLAPQNEDIAEAYKELTDQHRSRVKLDYELEKRGDNNFFHTTQLSGHTFVKPYTRIGAVAEANYFDTGLVRRTDGRIMENNGLRHRGEVYIQHDYERGDTARVGVLGGYNSLGAAASYKLADTYGDTLFGAEYQRANWDYIEGVVDGAVRDRVELGRRFRFSPRIQSFLTGGINRYSLKDEDNVAASYSLDGAFRYQLRPENPMITIGYILDAEYRFDEKMHTDSLGLSYMPLPLRSREVHFLDLAFMHEFSKTLVGEAFIGYGYDRLNENGGPSVGGSLTNDFGDDVQMQLRASHSMDTDGSGDDLERVGAYLMRKF